MVRNPEFLKSHFQEQRKETALEVRVARKEKREVREKNEKISALRKQARELKDKLVKYDGFLAKILDFRKFRELQTQLGIKEKEIGEKEGERRSSDSRDPKFILEDFHRRMRREWENAPYSQEEAEKMFTAEHLSGLNLEDYTTLLKRFPSHFVTHVTRQGIRDHTGGVSHTAGVGKYWDGFRSIMKGRRLENHLSVKMADETNLRSIAEFVGANPKTDQESVLARIEGMANLDQQHWDGSAADFLSVHMATEEVADAHYGAEKGNEIFFAYPSMYIAANKKFQGQLNRAEGGTHNNQWIMVDKEGLPIDAGIVFIPKDTRVSGTTGSRYELDKDFKPKLNKTLHEKINHLLKDERFKNFLQRAEKILGERADQIREEDREGLRQELEEVLGPENKEIKAGLMDYSNLSMLLTALYNIDRQASVDHQVDSFMVSTGNYYETANNTISSKDYWEAQFAKNPSLKPSKVVFYEGADPTAALEKWKQENGLNKQSARQDLGFSGNRVDLSNASNIPLGVARETGRFKTLAVEAVNNYYRDTQ